MSADIFLLADPRAVNDIFWQLRFFPWDLSMSLVSL